MLFKRFIELVSGSFGQADNFAVPGAAGFERRLEVFEVSVHGNEVIVQWRSACRGCGAVGGRWLRRSFSFP